MSKIYCSINNCHYWSQGNACDASEILVASDHWARQAPEKIDAPQHMQVPQMTADNCMETCCKTFVPKGSNQTEVDGVIRN